MLLSLLFNINRDKNAPAKRAEDFMPYHVAPEQTDEEFLHEMHAMFARIRAAKGT